MMSTPMLSLRRAGMAGIVAVALLACGCSVTRESPVKGTYLLEPALPAAAKSQAGALRIATINVAAPFRGRSFVYRETDLKFVSDYYEEWLVAPSAMVTEATVRALAAAKTFTAVAPVGQLADANWTLDGFVTSLYGDMRERAKPQAVLEITFYLTRSGDGAPIWSRSYVRRLPVAGGSPSAFAAAQNTALSEILAELVRDLAAAELPKS